MEIIINYIIFGHLIFVFSDFTCGQKIIKPNSSPNFPYSFHPPKSYPNFITFPLAKNNYYPMHLNKYPSNQSKSKNSQVRLFDYKPSPLVATFSPTHLYLPSGSYELMHPSAFFNSQSPHDLPNDQSKVNSEITWEDIENLPSNLVFSEIKNQINLDKPTYEYQNMTDIFSHDQIPIDENKTHTLLDSDSEHIPPSDYNNYLDYSPYENFLSPIYDHYDSVLQDKDYIYEYIEGNDSVTFLENKIKKLLDFPDDSTFTISFKLVIPYGSIPAKTNWSKFMIRKYVIRYYFNVIYSDITLVIYREFGYLYL